MRPFPFCNSGLVLLSHGIVMDIGKFSNNHDVHMQWPGKDNSRDELPETNNQKQASNFPSFCHHHIRSFKKNQIGGKLFPAGHIEP